MKMRSTACLAFGCLLCLGSVAPTTVTAQPQINKLLYASRGLEVAGMIESELGKSSSALYAESVTLSGTQFGGSDGHAYVWPAGIQFRVLNALARHDPQTYASQQKQFSNDLISGYRRTQRPRGYRSGVNSSADLFYDDNAHLVIAEADAYAITGDADHLNRAQSTYQYLLSGEDSVGGGGIWFREGLFDAKETISTLQAARAAGMLYRATGSQQYWDDAQRLYTWCEDHVQIANGTFYERYYVTGPNAGTAGDYQLVNGIGIAISANNEFYRATGDQQYLDEARRLASTALARYTNQSDGRINDEGFWAFEMTDALVDLFELDGDSRWSYALRDGLNWLYDNKRDPNGHYGKFWGREGPQTAVLSSWNLIDQAPVARAYLSLSQIFEGIPGDYNADGTVDAADYSVWRNNLGASVLRIPNTRGAGSIGIDQYLLWRENFGQTRVYASATFAAPEPAALCLLLAAGLLAPRRRR